MFRYGFPGSVNRGPQLARSRTDPRTLLTVVTLLYCASACVHVATYCYSSVQISRCSDMGIKKVIHFQSFIPRQAQPPRCQQRLSADTGEHVDGAAWTRSPILPPVTHCVSQQTSAVSQYNDSQNERCAFNVGGFRVSRGPALMLKLYISALPAQRQQPST